MSGLFGVVDKKNCPRILFYGTDYQSHLGTQKAGLAIINRRIERAIHNISTSQFKSKFIEEISLMKGALGIGVISDSDFQPIIISSSFGTFALATAGFLANKNELAKEIMKDGGSFSELSGGEINATEVAGKIIAQKGNLVEGVKALFEKMKGSFSLLILAKEGIYAARDKFGRTSLSVGKNDKSLAVTSETCAFPNLGYQKIKELSPGEIVLLSKSGQLIGKEKSSSPEKEKICAFLWIYTGYPASSYDGFSVEAVREHCGANLAKEDSAKADFVTGIPDSGIAHAIGYAMTSGLPYRRALVKYTPGYGRSYTPPSQETRDLIARMKLIPIKEIIEGQKIIICDDSIVRGTQLKSQAIEKLWQCGAKEIHVRIACPPLMFPCPYLLSTRTKKELAARRAIKNTFGGRKNRREIKNFLSEKDPGYQKMVNYLRQELNVTSLKFQTVENMIKAIGLPQHRLCLFCWLGNNHQP
ncbi:MAG TPA: amidophosphoribosyltransferase [Patescibacteria group bacterium]|nr:amidophosphoribosyltransferase [Patescibacteria group bacterium]